MLNQARRRLIIPICTIMMFSSCSQKQPESARSFERSKDLQNLPLTDPRVKGFLASLNGAGIPEAPEYKANGPHKVLVLSPANSALDWEKQMPLSWVPQTIAEVELIAIVHDIESHSVTVYIPDRVYDARPDPTAEEFSVHVEIREARSGRLLIEKEIRGSSAGYRATGPAVNFPDEPSEFHPQRIQGVEPVSGEQPTFKDASQLFDQYVNGQYVNGRLDFKPTLYAGSWLPKNSKGLIERITMNENSLPCRGRVYFRPSTHMTFDDVFWERDTGQKVGGGWSSAKIKLVDGVLSGQVAVSAGISNTQKEQVITFSDFHLKNEY